MILETLYKTSAKTSAIQVMDISANDGVMVVTWGQKNGKMQTRNTTCEPKNVGKSNETTAVEQAELEAKAYHAKKVKANYTTDEEAPTTSMLPMKVQTYAKHKKKVAFDSGEVWWSPKLNGVNATYRLDGNILSLKSRGGEDYPLIEQHLETVKAIMDYLITDELNGEIYIHGEHLQDITGAVKKYKELTDRLEFHIFDLPNVTDTYTNRLKKLDTVIETEFIKIVSTYEAISHEQLNADHDIAVAMGYEGIVIRNGQGLYEHNTRSNDVFKLKKALDAEYMIVNYNLDKLGHPVFEFRCGNSTFKAKPKGTAEERLTMADIADSKIGSWATIEYETFSKDGIPLKPVMIGFRECDADGNPLE